MYKYCSAVKIFGNFSGDFFKDLRFIAVNFFSLFAMNRIFTSFYRIHRNSYNFLANFSVHSVTRDSDYWKLDYNYLGPIKPVRKYS